MNNKGKTPIAQLNERSQSILRSVVDMYVASGTPVGSKALAQQLGDTLSSATIRNVMADLQKAGLLHSPHTSAGRVPTEAGLRLFVDALLETGDLSAHEQAEINQRCQLKGRNIKEAMEEATKTLSGLSQCAALVVAPKAEDVLKHIEFVPLGGGKGLVIIVNEDGLVENRIVQLPPGLPPAALVEATNYLNARARGLTLSEAREQVLRELEEQRAQLDKLSQGVVQAGLAVWGGSDQVGGTLIIRGQSNLLDNIHQIQDLERIRSLMENLETRRDWLSLLDQAGQAEGVRIFIGAESDLFGLSGCSMVVAPVENAKQRVVGALGVIGPTRLNYGRVVPMVDYTAKVMSKLLS